MYEQKYLKYKQKYLELKAKLEGGIFNYSSKKINPKIIDLQNKKKYINERINYIKGEIKKKVGNWNPFYIYSKINDNDSIDIINNKKELNKLENEINKLDVMIINLQKDEKAEANALKQKELVDREANQQRIREENINNNSGDMSSY
jgi:hypothetical protein